MMWLSCSHWGMIQCGLFEPVPANAYINWDGGF